MVADLFKKKGICGLYIHRTRNVFEGIIRGISQVQHLCSRILFNAFKKIFRFQMKNLCPEGQKRATQKKQQKYVLHGDLGGARTLDPMIKSHLLYQLSYEVLKGLQM